MSLLCAIKHNWSRWSLLRIDGRIVNYRYCRRCRVSQSVDLL